MKFKLKSAVTPTAFGLSCLATIAVLLPASPAYAGMGTSRPNPPPPPPPAAINLVAQEQSTDTNIGTKGYAGVAVNHAVSSPYDYNAAAGKASASCVTTANGAFRYVLCNTQTPDHWAMLFGITSAHTNSNIYIATDSTVKVKLSAGQTDVLNLAQNGRQVVWEMDYTLDRGQGESAPISTTPSILLSSNGGAEFDVSNVTVPRSLAATVGQLRRANVAGDPNPNDSTSKVTPVRPAFNPTNNGKGRVARSVFRMKRLEAFLKDSATGKKAVPPYKVMAWLDDPKKAEAYLEPGRSFTIYLDKMSAQAPK